MIADLPADALLQRYCEQGAYTDCFTIDVPGQVAHAAFVEAFYTTFVYIGSAVVRSSQGGAFRALLGFHKLYSRILLRAAVSRLRRA